jgi:hypothetical protein
VFGWRRRLPARLRPPLERDERVLAWARPGGATVAAPGAIDGVPALAAAGEVLVATNRGLWLPFGQPEPGFGGGEQVAPRNEAPRRLGWEEIHKAAWSGRELSITSAAVVAAADGYTVMADQPVLRYTLPEPGDLPHEVHARVTRSVAYTAHHSLPTGGGVRVAARRVPGTDGLRWTVRYDGGADADDPVVREATTQYVAQAQAATDL